MIFGYMRISTKKAKQTTDRQRYTLEKYAEENGFKFDVLVDEVVSGKVPANKRPVYTELKRIMIEYGNNPLEQKTLIITDIDRLGRDADDLIIEMKNLKQMGIKVVALDIPYLNEWKSVQDDSMYNMALDIYIMMKAHMAQQEREHISARVKEGVANAMQKYELVKGTPENTNPDGTEKRKRVGRPYAFTTEGYKVFEREYEDYLRGAYGKADKKKFARMLGISRTTLYKYIDFYEALKKEEESKAKGEVYQPAKKPEPIEVLQESMGIVD